jgi:hypothetical protein
MGDLWVPVAWFLLPSKDYTVYKSVLTYLKEEQTITDPEVVHLDFEIAESKAMLDVFPTTRVVGCDFHWKQVIIQIFILVIFINLLLFSGPEEEHAEAQVDRGVQQRPGGAGLVQEDLVLVNGATQGHRSNMGEDQ